jgi:5-methylcytosine-specific restriction endonuclease McrA
MRKTLEQRARKREDIRIEMFEYLLEHPCIDCGEDDPVVLEFDHRDAADKHFTLGRALAVNPSLERLRAEMAKCDVRCANCHRRKTSHEFDNYRTRERRARIKNAREG